MAVRAGQAAAQPFELRQCEYERVREPLPPFTGESAAQKVQAAEDAWNARDPVKVAAAYSEDTCWRNRSEFITRQLDFAVRTAVAALLQAYEPSTAAPFTGPSGPSGYQQGRA